MMTVVRRGMIAVEVGVVGMIEERGIIYFLVEVLGGDTRILV